MHSACQAEMLRVSMIGPELAQKIAKLKDVQQRMASLQERREKILEKLVISGSLIEPTLSQ